MNIFYLDESPKIAASYHCDKHVIKMILETAQLLSTAHRELDGQKLIGQNEVGRKTTKWIHPHELRDATLYGATHINHPSAVWVRQSSMNYMWAYELMLWLNFEFVNRYQKTDDHLTIRKLKNLLSLPPAALVDIDNQKFTPPPKCMPEQYHYECAVQSYRNYYINGKADICVWKTGNIPE
jgi:hypothetical protein